MPRLALRSVLAAAVLGVCALLVPPSSAAQYTYIGISPGSGSWSGTTATHGVLVTISWCSEGSMGTRSVTLNGQPVSMSFKPMIESGCSTAGTSTGTVHLSPGTNSLVAQTSTGGYAQASYTYTQLVSYPPTVAAEPASASVQTGSSQWASFRVTNPGTAQTTYTLSASCSWGAACSPSWGSVTLAGGASTPITVAYTAPAAGSASVSLTGTGGGGSNTATQSLTVNPVPVPDATVGISPPSGSWSGTAATHGLLVSVSWCTEGTLGTRSITLNGQAVSMSFKPEAVAGCSQAGTSTGTVQLPPGSSTLRAENIVNGVVRGYAQASYGYTLIATYPPTVGAEPTSASIQSGSAGTAHFRVTNPGTAQTTYTLSASCSWGAACSPSSGSVTLGGGAWTVVTVAYTAPAAGSASVSLTGSGGGGSNTATQSLTVNPIPVPDATVGISPPSGSWSGTAATHGVLVNVSWCTEGTLGTRSITLNGQAVSMSFKPEAVAGCSQAGTSTGTVQLPPGSSTLRAENIVNGVVRGYAQASYGYTLIATYPPTVGAEPTSASIQSGSAGTAHFRVTNPGTAQTTYTLSASCSWGAACSPSSGSVTLGGGAWTVVTVAYTAPAAGSASVSLTGSGGGGSTTGTQSLTVTAVAPTVTAEPATASVPGGSPQTATFRVANTGAYTTTYSLSTVCSWGAACPPSTTTLTVAAGASNLVSVSYTAPASGSGTVRLTASAGSVSATGTLSVTTVPVSVRVTPVTPTVTVAGGTLHSARFWVVNTGGGSVVFNLTLQCTNAGTCGISTSSRSLAPGDSATAEVSYTAPASGTAQVGLRAEAFGTSATGTVAVTALPAPAIGFPGDSVSLLRHERAACVTAAVGPAAAYECGDLRVVQELPAVRELNRARAPVLMYNSQHARPYPIVAEQVGPRAGTAPDSIRAVLTLNGVAQTPRSWAAWAAGTLRYIAVVGDAATLPTGTYPYTIQVSAHWNSGASEELKTRTGELVVVNRGASPFGAGWWLSGVEQLVHLANNVKLWVGGDGSARLYRPTDVAGRWAAEEFTRPDTLKLEGTEYVRTLAGGAKVRFSSAGEHLRTVNTLGQATVFTWASGRLARIDMPATTDMPAPAHYLFEYQNNTGTATPRLSLVRAPWLSGYRDVRLTTDQHARVTAITDPYLGAVPPDTIPKVQFGYHTTTSVRLWMTSRTDRTGAVQDFIYANQRLRDARRIPVPGDTVMLRFFPAEGRGLSAVTTDVIRTQMNGPRGTVNGQAEQVFWWVDRWGAPVRVRTPRVGGWSDTYLYRGDPRWPGLVTRTVDPVGMATTATYDVRGNVISQTAWNPYGDGRNAITTYAWDPRWDAVTQVTLPEGEVSLTQYDTYGRREWDQLGVSDSTRVRYYYHPLNHARAPGMAERTVQPGGVRTDRYEYDARGNLSATVSPIGFRTVIQNDLLGRVASTRTPIDSAQTTFQKDTVVYDLSDQTMRTESWGPVNAAGQLLTGQQRVVVVNTYDREGRPLSVSRSAVPDIAGVGVITTRWEYDLIGRRTVEVAPDLQRDSTYYDRGGNAVRTVTRRRIATRAGTSYSLVAGEITMEYDIAGRMTKRRRPEVTYAQRTEGIAKPGNRKNLGGENPPYPSYPNNAAGGYTISADSATFEYHPHGGLKRADNPDARVVREYHRNGQLRLETQSIRTTAGADFSQHAYTLEYRYDRNGRPTGVRHPNQLTPAGSGNHWNSYTYNALGALHAVTDVLGNSFTHGYAADGALASIVRPGGVDERYVNDADGRLRTHNVTVPGGNLRTTAFRYDARGKLLWTGNNALSRDTITAVYSALGHAVSGRRSSRGINLAGGPQRSSSVETSTYDALAFRTSVAVADTFWLATSPGWPAGNAYYEDNSSRGDAYRYVNGTGRLRAMQQDTFHYDADGNTEFTTRNSGASTDVVSFYAADGTLVASERRISGGNEATPLHRVFEEYRYDALGRRVWTRARRWCQTETLQGECRIGKIRRTVWDGDREFYEIQMPGGDQSAHLERDVGTVNEQRDNSGSPPIDPNPFFGRVAYTYGHGIDRPLSIVRMGYEDLLDSDGALVGHWTAAPFAIFPLWNSRGQGDLGVFANGQIGYCVAAKRCIRISWPGTWFDMARPKVTRNAWHGSLLEDKEDAAGTLYRRNRSYDPRTGQFTQEDPIGLAGGLNTYGFANGDPISYSDPYGLCAVAGAAGSIAMGGALAAATGSEYGLGNAVFDGVTGAICVGTLVRGIQVLRHGRRATQAARTAQASRATTVYRSVNTAGDVQYVGITNNLARRSAEHLSQRGMQIEPLLDGLSRSDGRAVEQALIEIHGLGRNGGTLLNKINSIAESNPAYADQLRRGYELLGTIGYR